MVEGDSARYPCVTVVGDARDDLGKQVLCLARQFVVEVVRCDDVYAAAAELVTREKGRVLLAGRFWDMVGEGGRLFALAIRNDAWCCAWLDRGNPLDQGDILGAIRAGVVFIDRAEQMESLLQDWLAGAGGPGRRLGRRSLADEEFRATEAELNALLGREVDG